MIKFKMINGQSSISFEGKLEDAEILLGKYWVNLSQSETNSTSSKSKQRPAKTKAKKSPALKGAAAISAAGVEINAQELANKIKSHSMFPQVKKQILDKKGGLAQKCKMTAYFAERSITSGDVKRLMDELKIKSGLPALSMALSRNSSDFLTNGDNPVKYELTASALEQFEKWLASDDDG